MAELDAMVELAEVHRLRLKLKAAKPLLRDLLVAVAQAEEALERQAHAQPQRRAQHGTDQEQDRAVAV